MSEKAKSKSERMSEYNRKRWADPEYRKQKSEAGRKQMEKNRQNPEFCAKLRKATSKTIKKHNKTYWTKETREKHSVRVSEAMADQEFRTVLSEKCKAAWKDNDQRREKARKAFAARGLTITTPNKLEARYKSMVQEKLGYTLDFVSGSMWLTTQAGHKSPDFRVGKTKKLIEVFGDYFHKGEDPSVLVGQYKEIGYDCLVLWEHEINNNKGEVALNKTKNFLSEVSSA